MKNEIKEILDFLLYNDKLTTSGKRKLRDYITNLQQKNKMLQENVWRNNSDLIDKLKEELEKTDCEYCDICEDYKSRIEKAVKYISSGIGKSLKEEYCCFGILLNILNGRSDE